MVLYDLGHTIAPAVNLQTYGRNDVRGCEDTTEHGCEVWMGGHTQYSVVDDVGCTESPL